uniref:Uncharacterized protein n=1 Tax=Rhizophora mucronata TaxID=61149 RepID=A0A2P2LWY8_RHIMU
MELCCLLKTQKGRFQRRNSRKRSLKNLMLFLQSWDMISRRQAAKQLFHKRKKQRLMKRSKRRKVPLGRAKV